MPLPSGVKEPGLRPLRLSSRYLGLPTMQAWNRILHAYAQRHPLQQARIFYHHLAVRDLKELVQHSPRLDHRGFELQFRSPDGDEQELPRLLTLLTEAASQRGQHFLSDADPAEWFAPQASAQAI